MNNLPELDERKGIILKFIIKSYLETGEPVGSRTISKNLDINLSSATIRNEMSDLEEMGYIIKPHTSAGRIPSDRGYRFYVDNLMQEKNIEIENFKAEMTEKVDRLENMMKGLVKTLANNTNYAALISGPTIINNKIKYVQISKLEDKKILVVVVAEGNLVKTHIVDMDTELKSKDILNISVVINDLLTGREVSETIDKNFDKEINKIKEYNKEIKTIIDNMRQSLQNETPENSIYTFGANNFFKYKELLENESANNLLETFEHKNELASLIEANNKNETGLRIYIGEESPIESMKDCSVVTANCDFGNGMIGTIGVVGPKRMDYEKVIKTIKSLMDTAKDNLQN